MARHQVEGFGPNGKRILGKAPLEAQGVEAKCPRESLGFGFLELPAADRGDLRRNFFQKRNILRVGTICVLCGHFQRRQPQPARAM